MSEPIVPPATPPAAAPTPSDWTTGLNDDMKGYVQNKGFKDPVSVLESYRNYEKLMGVPQDRLLKLPEKAEDAEGWKGIYNRLGRPEKAEDYKVAAPEGASEEYSKWAKGTFHELNLTRAQGEALSNKWNEFSSNAIKAQEAAQVAESEKQLADLKREWGSDYDQKAKSAKLAAAKFGLDEKTIDQLEIVSGYGGIMKFLHAVGSTIGEDQFVSGKGVTSGKMSAEGAKNRIKELSSDREFYSRLQSGSVAEKTEWDNLHVLAYSS